MLLLTSKLLYVPRYYLLIVIIVGFLTLGNHLIFGEVELDSRDTLRYRELDIYFTGGAVCAVGRADLEHEFDLMTANFCEERVYPERIVEALADLIVHRHHFTCRRLDQQHSVSLKVSIVDALIERVAVKLDSMILTFVRYHVVAKSKFQDWLSDEVGLHLNAAIDGGVYNTT